MRYNKSKRDFTKLGPDTEAELDWTTDETFTMLTIHRLGRTSRFTLSAVELDMLRQWLNERVSVQHED